MIAFTVHAVPVAQPRGRAAVSKSGKPFVRSANAGHAINGFKGAVAYAAAQAYTGPPLDIPLRMRIVFVMPRPGGMVWKNKPMPRAPYAPKGRHDWTTLAKACATP